MRLITGRQIIEDIFQNGSKFDEKTCSVMWFQTPHRGYTPWIEISCNELFADVFFICEYSNTDNEQYVPLPPENPNAKCMQGWTQIADMCIRLIKTDDIP